MNRHYIKKRSRKEQVYEQIRDRILSQEYAIGSKINIHTLSTELKVSNTPVREALSMLERDGLVSSLPNAGFQVFRPSKDEVASLEETMSVLITGSFVLCRQQNKIPELIKQMEERLEKQRQIIEHGTQMEIAQAAIFFDEVFFSVLNNIDILRLYQVILNKMVLLVYYDHTHGNSSLMDEFHEHEQILDAVRNGDNELAVTLIVKHFTRAVQIA